MALAAIWLHHDRARHMRMNVAEIFVGAGRGEREGEFVVGVQCLRPWKGIIVRGNAVRDIVLVVNVCGVKVKLSIDTALAAASCAQPRSSGHEPSMPPALRHDLEARMLAGETISAPEIRRARVVRSRRRSGWKANGFAEPAGSCASASSDQRFADGPGDSRYHGTPRREPRAASAA
jgi:hypothetical protein